MKFTAAALTAGLSMVLVPAAYADEQITLHNTSPFQVTMNVDGHFGCTANSGVDCTSAHETVASHDLTAIYQGQVVKQTTIPVSNDYTWTICYGDYPRTHNGQCPGD